MSLRNIAKYCGVTQQYFQVLPSNMAILPRRLPNPESWELAAEKAEFYLAILKSDWNIVPSGLKVMPSIAK